MILCIGTTPAAQRVMVFRHLVIDSVNRAATTLDGAAGKSINVAKVLKRLGEDPFAVGFLGGDRGEQLGRILEEQGVASEFVMVSSRTRQCITVVDQGSGSQTELVEESPGVSAEEYEKLLAIVRKHMTGCRAAVMSGTLAPGVPANFYAECTRLARAASAIALVDAQGQALTEALKQRPDLVKPNRTELAATVGYPLTDEQTLIQAMKHLHERGARQVVVTAGADSTVAFDGRQAWRISSPRIKAVNPIGSGDSFTAGLVASLLKGDNLGEACRHGAAAGAANALTLMAGEVELGEITRLLKETWVKRLG